MATLRVKLREADIEECRQAGIDPSTAVDLCIQHSTEAFVIKVEDVPAVYWGYAAGPALTSSCSAWMLSTDAVERGKMKIGRASIQAIQYMMSMFSSITIIVDMNYELAVKWLKWLGFVPIRTHGRFMQMERTRDGTA